MFTMSCTASCAALIGGNPSPCRLLSLSTMRSSLQTVVKNNSRHSRASPHASRSISAATMRMPCSRCVRPAQDRQRAVRHGRFDRRRGVVTIVGIALGGMVDVFNFAKDRDQPGFEQRLIDAMAAVVGRGSWVVGRISVALRYAPSVITAKRPCKRLIRSERMPPCAWPALESRMKWGFGAWLG